MSKITTVLKGNIRIYITEATNIAQEAMDLHKTKPLGSLLLSTAIASFGTFISLYKEQKTSSIIKGNGASKTILVETNPNGDIRALIGNPLAETDADKKDFNNIPLTVGIGDEGTLKIVREVNGTYFGGEVKLANFDIVTDLAFYFDQSDQIYSAVVSDVELETPTKIKRANSVIFQMLPNHTDEEKLFVEIFIKNNKLSELGPKKYIEKLGGMIIDTKEIRWNCSCSMDKMKEVISVIPKEEQAKIIKEEGKLEVRCNYCNKNYKIK